METAKTVKCQVHKDQVAVENALVPAISLIAREIGRTVTPAVLLDRAVCVGARVVLRRRGVMLFPYLDTLQRVEKRSKERLAASDFASRYRTVRDRRPETKPTPTTRPVTVFVDGEMISAPAKSAVVCSPR